MQYGVIWTLIGQAKRANAEISGSVVTITHFALGDANGNEAFEPIQDMEALVNEVYRRPVDSVQIDETNPAWVNVDGHILAADGGWWVREIGFIDADGDLVAVGNNAPFYKPLLSEGEGDDLYLRAVLLTSNTAVIQLKINPAVAMASRKYVDDGGAGWKAAHIRKITASGAVLSTDRIVVIDATAGDVTLMLLAAASAAARKLIVIREDASANHIYLQAAAGETLPTSEGRGQTLELTMQDEAITLMPNGVSHYYRVG